MKLNTSDARKVLWLAPFLFLHAWEANAARIKDIVQVKGVRENLLIGYGLVVGLKGTGDSSDVTARSLVRMFKNLGLDVKDEVKSQNVASVVVTAKLPPFARAGQKIDIDVSSVGDAGSLEGGTLLITPLRAGDQQVYAVAQGSVSVGSLANGSGNTFKTVGRVPGGALVEREVQGEFSNKRALRLNLKDPDFTTIARLTQVINTELAGKYATAADANTVDLIVPFSFDGNAVELMAVLENLTVNVDVKSKIVISERTGTVVAGGDVRIRPVALAHGELSIQVDGDKKAKKGEGKKVLEIQKTSSVGDLVGALNAFGVAPKDLTAIFQALKKADALEGELEIF
jgi:flagellar P-ring protein precursor FlgI